MNWHSMSVDEVVKRLRTSINNGLSRDEASRRLLVYGRNELTGKGRSLIKVFAKQFANFLIIILIVSAVVAWILGEVTDASAILFIIAVMGVAGFLQEFRAERALEALRRLAIPKARVLRDGNIVEVSVSDLVPGDIVILSEGDRVPADLRLAEADELLIDESPLTGESVPIRKDPSKVLPPNTPLTERVNMAFMGTHVVSGRGVGVVVSTGMNTVLGGIARSVSEVRERRTLLEEELDRLGRKLGVIILGISAAVFALSVIVGRMSLINSLILAIALAVAAIPEGLPAVATSVLAIGAYRMSKRNVIVRELGAIESLGACDIIASDKTGTITKGEMTVKYAWVGGYEFSVEGSGYSPKGLVRPLSSDGEEWRNALLEVAKMIVMHVGTDASVINKDGSWIAKGSPTEAAALVFAYKSINTLRAEVPGSGDAVKTYPFNRFRKRKVTVHRIGSKYLVVASGAPEILLELSSNALTREGEVRLGTDLRRELNSRITEMAGSGYRVLGIAYKYVDKQPVSISEAEEGLTFAALLGIIDPPREGVKEAIEEVRRAGIKVLMITGDHRLTAEAVARMIGLSIDEGGILEGRDIDSMSDEELREAVEKAIVFARVTPEHKRRIVKALRANGHVVAMTGDGVNDAPALKEADIGIAMGVRGTDVAREVAKLILRDDNFVSIVAAVREGRIIYENLKKPINYLLPANIGEVVTIFLSEVLGLPPPLNAPQLLWINVTTDSLPALALSAEPAEPGIMLKPPRGRRGEFITRRKLTYFTLLGGLIGLVNIALFTSLLPLTGLVGARTVAFTAIALSEFGRALTSRSEERHFWLKPFNKWLPPALTASVLLQLAAVYTPYLNTFFNTSPIPPQLLAIAAITAVPVLVVDEVRKYLRIKLS